jgi:excisionase family DNA binding protein
MSKITTESYTPAELASFLNVSSKTVLRMIRLGKISPVIRFSKKTIRIPRSSFDAYVQACTQPSLDPPKRS